MNIKNFQKGLNILIASGSEHIISNNGIITCSPTKEPIKKTVFLDILKECGWYQVKYDGIVKNYDCDMDWSFFTDPDVKEEIPEIEE